VSAMRSRRQAGVGRPTITMAALVASALVTACGPVGSSPGDEAGPTQVAAPSSVARSTDATAPTTAPTTIAPTTIAPTTVPTTTVLTTAPPVTAAQGPRPAPAVPDDPAVLADELTRTEASLVSGDPATAEFAAAAHHQQLLFRVLAERPEWDSAVLDLLDEPLRRVAEVHLAARREFLTMYRRWPTTLPAWTIVAPAPAEELIAHYRRSAEANGVPWEVLAAINLVETGMGRISGLSSANARGPMQFIPGTWDLYGQGDIDDPADAIMAAGRLLSAMGAAEDLERAVSHYNPHMNYVRGVLGYASLIVDDPATYHRLYHWEVQYRAEQADLWLPIGWHASERQPVEEYLTGEP
jgi:membrane-bound lytic murein transglycosylase B